MINPQVEAYYAAIATRLKLLREKLEELERESYETKTPFELIRFLKKITSELSRATKINRSACDPKLGRNVPVALANLRKLDTKTGQLYSYLRWVESSKVGSVHGPLVKAFLLLVCKRLKRWHISENQILVRAKWNYGFTYQNISSTIYKAIDGIVKDIPMNKRFYMVSYPRIERDNAFILSNLAHEIGHLFDECTGGIAAEGNPVLKVAYDEIEEIWNETSENRLANKLAKELRTRLEKELADLTLRARPLSREIVSWRTKSLVKDYILPKWLQECFSDVFAARILPIPYLFSLAETLTTYRAGPEYPTRGIRLSLVIEEIDHMGLTDKLKVLSNAKEHGEIAKAILEKIDGYRIEKVGPPEAPSDLKEIETKDIMPHIVWAAVKKAIVPIRKSIRQTPTPKFNFLELFNQVELLERGIPPNEAFGVEDEPPKVLNIEHILTIGWIFWLTMDSKQKGHGCPFGGKRREKIKQDVSRLLLKAIESSSVHNYYTKWRKKIKSPVKYDLLKTEKPDPVTQGALSRANMLAWMKRPISEGPLVVTPLLDPHQIGESSLDVRLGNVFIAFRRARFSELNLSRPTPQSRKFVRNLLRTKTKFEDPKKVICENSERVRLRFGSSFVLHPGEFVLASTLEYLSLPLDLMAYVAGKSSLGRLGLVIATATQIAPGFKGSLTLELANVGTVPIRLFPGLRIAQFIFHSVKGIDPKKGGYTGYYYLSTEPKTSGIYDKEIDLEFLEFLGDPPQR